MTSVRTVLLLALALIAGAPAPARQPEPHAAKGDLSRQRLDAWLKERPLTRLRVALLELDLESSGTNRAEAARNLADLYTDLLDNAPDDAARKDAEQRAAAMLAQAPDLEAPDLRLALARSVYARAEEIAERHRLRLSEPGAADAARASLVDLSANLVDLAAHATRRVEQFERQEEQATGESDRELVAKGLGMSRRTRSMAHFYAGWSAVYIAELGPADARHDWAAKALRHFGWLLNAKPGEPAAIARLPEQTLGLEHVARAAAGVAMALSLMGDDIGAQRWLDALDASPSVAPAIKAQLLARRAILLARASRWDDIAVLLPRGVGGAVGADLPPTTARLITVLALDGATKANAPPTCHSLAEIGLAALAAQGQTAQVLDLTARYVDRLEALTQGAFMPSYLRGLREYERARRSNGQGAAQIEGPASTSEARDAFAAAEKFLALALDAADKSRFGPALGGVSLLRARSALGAASTAPDLSRAAELFRDAAIALAPRDPAQAALAMRLALHALDLAIAQGPSPDLAQQRRTTVDQFVSLLPDSPAAAALVYERALAGDIAQDQAINDLLRLAHEGPLAPGARYHAARLLYEQWRARQPGERAEAARAFLDAAEPALDDARRLSIDDGAEAVERAVTNARRVLDVSLTELPQQPRSARRALDLLQSLIARGLADPAPIAGELEYRRVQAALGERDIDAAQLALARLEAHDPRLASSALRLIYQRASEEWAASEPPWPGARALDERVMHLGQLILAEIPDPVRALDDPAIATLHCTVAQAAGSRRLHTQNSAAGALADTLFERLLSVHPRDGTFLRAAGIYWLAAGKLPKALSAWRTLASGLPQGSEEWFEARWHTLAMLSRLDPPRARAQLAQHKVLFPDMGPPPWGPRLAELVQALESPGAPSSAPASIPAEGLK